MSYYHSSFQERDKVLFCLNPEKQPKPTFFCLSRGDIGVLRRIIFYRILLPHIKALLKIGMKSLGRFLGEGRIQFSGVRNNINTSLMNLVPSNVESGGQSMQIHRLIKAILVPMRTVYCWRASQSSLTTGRSQKRPPCPLLFPCNDAYALVAIADCRYFNKTKCGKKEWVKKNMCCGKGNSYSLL